MIINIYDEWEKNWNNAYKFFNSKGNVRTRSKLKAKWFKDFKEVFYKIESNSS